MTLTTADTASSGVGGTAPVTASGGQLLATMLHRHGVGPMFGMGGFQLLPFYGAVESEGLRHHLINDERTGAFAADAYARVSGRVGVCDGTLGPGATNLVTGLVESLNASIPLVALVGNSERTHSGKHMTQETDQSSILRPAVKELLRVERAERMPEMVRRAFAVATSGRPGPVALDIPEDVAHQQVTLPASELWIDPATCAIPARRTRPDRDEVERAAQMLSTAQRPVVLVGGGVHLSGAHASLQTLAEELGLPVAHTMSGKGSIACTHPLSVGLFGRYSRTANDLIEAADVVLVVGCKLGEIATKRFELLSAETKVARLEVDAADLGRTARVDVGLVGDARLGLEDILAASRECSQFDRTDYLTEVRAGMEAWRVEVADRLTDSGRPIGVARLVHELNDVLTEDSVVVADGGFASHWTGLLYDTKRAGRGYIADRGFASIGYGLPGALGATLGSGDDTTVVGVTGDGGFNMTIGDLETAVRVGRPFTLIVINNAASGYVKALQHVMLAGHYQSADLTPLNYAYLAEGFGAKGIRVEDPNELPQALRAAVSADRPTVVDVIVTRDPAEMLPGVDNRLRRAIEQGDGRVV